ncbi:MAG: hypothetical protein KDA90_11285 [Planctomycetaceae bacterium]|nr:hypothetical protein [Planctomycetaceae bacterium]
MTWKNARATIIWMVVLSMGAIIAGGYYASQFLTNANAIIERTVRQKLEELAPDWQCDFEDLVFDSQGYVQLKQVRVRPRGVNARADILRIGMLQVDLDRDLLHAEQRIVVRHVLIREPQVIAFRGPDGRWNWEGHDFPQSTSGVSPPLTIENGAVVVGIQQADNAPVTEFRSERIDAKLLPAAFRRYQGQVNLTIDGLGRLQANGLVDANTGEWNLSGSTQTLQIRDQLLSQIASFVPGGEHQLARLGITPTASENVAPVTHEPYRFAGLSHERPSQFTDAAPTSSAVPALRADAEIDFHIGQKGKGQQLDYALTADIQRGQLSEAILPVPLLDLSTRIEFTPSQLIIKQLTAANGESRLFVDGALTRDTNGWRKEFVLRATQLKMDRRIRQFLPPGLLKLYDLVQPAGLFDVDVGVVHEADSSPVVTLRKFTAIDCSAIHAMFPYPVHHAKGDIRQEGPAFHINIQGEAGETPVSLTGFIIPDGPRTQANLTVKANGVPIDDRVHAALSPPNLEGALDTVKALDLHGRVDATANFVKRGEQDPKILMQLDLTLHEGSLNFVRFPWPLTSVSGRVTYDALKRKAWMLTDLEGRHGEALVRGHGIFDQDTAPGLLALQLELMDVPIDGDLRRATTTANPSLETIWTDYGLLGNVDVNRVEVGWVPGGNAIVSLFGMQWKDGRMKPKVLPFSWENIAGALEWVDNRLTIHSLHGWHGDTYMHVDGTRNGANAYIETDISKEQPWHLHLGSLQIVKLSPRDEVRRALPESLAEVLQTLDVQGTIDLQLGLDLKGWATPELVTAQWNAVIGLQHNNLVAGIPLQDVSGAVKLVNGSWNGKRVTLDGYVELDQATVLDMPLKNVKGPFRMDGNEILLGSKGQEEGNPFDELNIYRNRKLAAEIFGGRLGVLSVVQLVPGDESRTQYRVDVKVEDAELGEWAKHNRLQANRLSGKVNGEVLLTGIGTQATSTLGEGWVQITPAQLYELPVFAQIFAFINFRQPDDTAFNYGFGEFSLHEGLIDFSSIELVGDTLNLKGRGVVGYAGPQQSNLALDFYTKASNRVPILRPLIEKFGSNWVRIQVIGTVSSPIPLVQPRIPLLDNAFQGFMQTIDNGQRRPLPRPSSPVPISPNAARPAVPR